MLWCPPENLSAIGICGVEAAALQVQSDSQGGRASMQVHRQVQGQPISLEGSTVGERASLGALALLSPWTGACLLSAAAAYRGGAPLADLLADIRCASDVVDGHDSFLRNMSEIPITMFTSVGTLGATAVIATVAGDILERGGGGGGGGVAHLFTP